MRVTYAGAANDTTNGVALGDTQDDVRVYKLIIGNPVASADLYFYTNTNPVDESTSNIALKVTLPGTLPTTGADIGKVIDFGPKGLPLGQGGNFQQDQACQCTIIWGLAGEE